MKFKKKFISSILVAGLVISNIFVANADTRTQNLEVHHINVGQGESIYIELPNGDDILIDAGKSNYGTTVVNYLNGQENGMVIDYLIATHPDADHVGGMQEVFKSMKVNNFYYPTDAPHDTQTWKNVLNLANSEGCSIKDSTPGTKINGGGAELSFIHSNTDFADNNDDSVVTLLDYNDTEFMFCGDIEAIAEKNMISNGLVKDIDFMSMPHHGSKGSSTTELLNLSKPEHVVVSVGENSYGHPTQDALARYANIGAKVYRTDQLGDIVIKTDGNISTINGSSINGNPVLNDVAGHWASSQIQDFINKGYINGYKDDNTFRPENPITRAEFVKTLNKTFGLTATSGVVFNDTVNHWSKNEIDIAVTNGVCQGTSSSNFNPDSPITREAAAKMISNYKKIADTHHNKLNAYNDAWQVSSWARNEVEGILEAGYMNGYSDINTFKPLNNITRAEAVVTLSRVESNPNPVIPEPPVVPDPEPTPPPVVENIVYANGGSSSSNKYHKSSNAHGMKEAIKMSESEAKSKGYIPCGTCFR